MKTIEQFQEELAQLRQERDRKQTEANDIRVKADIEYKNAKKALNEEEQSFREKNEAIEAALHQVQTSLRQAFKILMAAKRADVVFLGEKAKHDLHVAKRRINEEYSDKIALAFARYNKERKEAGLPSIHYDRDGTMIPQEASPSANQDAGINKGGYNEEDWPQESAPDPENN